MDLHSGNARHAPLPDRSETHQLCRRGCTATPRGGGNTGDGTADTSTGRVFPRARHGRGRFLDFIGLHKVVGHDLLLPLPVRVLEFRQAHAGGHTIASDDPPQRVIINLERHAVEDPLPPCRRMPSLFLEEAYAGSGFIARWTTDASQLSRVLIGQHPSPIPKDRTWISRGLDAEAQLCATLGGGLVHQWTESLSKGRS